MFVITLKAIQQKENAYENKTIMCRSIEWIINFYRM